MRAYLQPLALQPLKAMLQQGDRYEQRDASIALLGLLYTEVRQLRVGQRRTVAGGERWCKVALWCEVIFWLQPCSW